MATNAPAVPRVQPEAEPRDIVILVNNPSSIVEELAKGIALHLQKSIEGCTTHLLPFSSLSSHSPNTCYISTLAMDSHFSSHLDQEDIAMLRTLSTNSTDFLWLTDGIAEGDGIESKVENLTDNMRVLDLGPTDHLMPTLWSTCENITKALAVSLVNTEATKKQSGGQVLGEEKEFVQSNRELYVGRRDSIGQIDSLAMGETPTAVA